MENGEWRMENVEWRSQHPTRNFQLSTQNPKMLQYLILHCTATPQGREVSAAHIRQWHLQGRGWSRVGYTDLITLDGTLVNLTPFDQDDDVAAWELTNGVRGLNSISRHVVYAGGCDAALKPKDTRTAAQKACVADYVRYTVRRHPHIQVAGHYHFAPKACPAFQVEKWCRQIGIQEQNILKMENGEWRMENGEWRM